MNLDIDCLRSFVLVVDSMSVSRTAAAIGRSQSTVSQQIGKLEAQTGRRLLARRKGRVIEPTPDGDRLLDYARRILALNDEAEAALGEDRFKGLVRLGVPLDFFGRDFTRWLARFKAQHPMVGLEVEAHQSEHLVKRVQHGEFDLAFFKQEAGGRRGTMVLREQLVWATGARYRPQPGQSLPLILFPEGCGYRRVAIAALRAGRVDWHASFVSPSFECLRTAVAEGLGVTVLARALVAPPLRVLGHAGGLPALPSVELACAFGRRQRPRVVDALARHLSDCLLEAPPELASAA